jgi:DNA-binding transcriptional regulator GbsR (MarR family)
MPRRVVKKGVSAGGGEQPGPCSEEERQFSDELGFFWEDAGGTRMAGRVLGALLLADPPGLSSSELAELLGASAASISTATRELIRPGLAERVRVPGKREDYFRTIMGNNVPQFLRDRIESTRRYTRLMQRGETLASSKDPDVRRQLEQIREFFEFLEAEQHAILERWEHRQEERETR